MGGGSGGSGEGGGEGGGGEGGMQQYSSRSIARKKEGTVITTKDPCRELGRKRSMSLVTCSGVAQSTHMRSLSSRAPIDVGCSTSAYTLVDALWCRYSNEMLCDSPRPATERSGCWRSVPAASSSSSSSSRPAGSCTVGSLGYGSSSSPRLLSS